MASVAPDPTRLTNCEAEPIRFPGAVQPHGAVLLLDADTGVVEAASDSCARLLGMPAAQLLGQPVGACLGPELQAALLDDAADPDPVALRAVDGAVHTAQTHRNPAGQVLVDIEPGDPASPRLLRLARACRRGVKGLRAGRDIVQVTQAAAALVRELSGFDRVMVYRFDAGWNGEVLAEARAEGVESLLGLHYPASDIPSQAREMFQACCVRAIPDARYVPSALVARGDRHAIDLGRSSLRSVSPDHLEYLANMQVRATLTGALIVEGRLWGLLACHQLHEPRFLEPGERAALGGLCEDLGALIQLLQLQQWRDREVELALRRRRLADLLRLRSFKELMREDRHADLLGVVGADGFAFVTDEAVHSTGRTPSVDGIRELVRRRRVRAPTAPLYATSALGRDLGPAALGTDGVAGAMFVSVFHRPALSMIWFRDERGRSVRWSGNPDEPYRTAPDGRLSPRKSFALFLQAVSGQALEWSAEELDSAAELGSLIEIESLREREAFARTVLNSIPVHILVLDARGVIVSVNAAWQEFVRAHGAPQLAERSVGSSYLEICTAACSGPRGRDAATAWTGIAAVLDGTRPDFSMDYPVETTDTPRWLRLLVHPMLPPDEGVLVAHADITDSKLAELALRRESEKNRVLLRHASDGIHILDLDGRVVEVSDSFCTMLGYRREEMLGMHVTEWGAPGRGGFIRAAVAGHARSRDRVQFETLHRRKDGRIFDVEVSGQALELEGRSVLFYSSRDITQRKATERALAANEARLRTIFESMAEGTVLHRADGAIVDANPAAEVLLGLSRDQLLGRSSIDPRWQALRADGSDYPGPDHPAMQTLRTGRALRHEVMGIRAPGHGERWISINTQPVFAQDATRPEAVVATFIDITQQIQAATRLNEANAHLETLAARQAMHLRALARDLAHAEQRERDRLYELLHGGVQPLLVAARLSLSGLSLRTSRDEGLRLVGVACAQISQVIEATRTLSLQLNPPLLLEHGLVAALESLGNWVRKHHGLAVGLHCAPGVDPDDSALRLLCFNAVRELLMNVVKHAGVQAARVTLSMVDGSTLRIEVADAGVGLNGAGMAGGSGLAAISRRLGMFGGTLRIDSRAGSGTVVTLLLPSREPA